MNSISQYMEKKLSVLIINKGQKNVKSCEKL